MIELDRHIEILLLSNDCVIVPDLGGFMAHHADARYEAQEHMFLPPFRTLGFNPQLKMNDSLLVQSYIEAYDISYPEALRRIQDEVAELRQHLETEGLFELNDIGTLRLNDEGNMEFEPCEAGILTPELYGLGSFQMLPLRGQEEAEPSEGKVAEQTDESTITIKMSWLRNMVAAAAAVVAFLMITSPVSNSQMTSTTQQSAFMPISAPQAIKDVLEQPVPTEETPTAEAEEQSPVDDIQEPSADIQPVATDTQETYCIVLASQVSKRNAEYFIHQLSKQGFNDARILETSFRRVVYGAFGTHDAATEELQNLRRQSSQFKDSWVMKIK